MHRDVFPEWCEPTTDLTQVGDRHIDVWRFCLADPGTAADTAPDGRARARQMMLSVLGRYLRRPSNTLQFATLPGGKPQLDMPGRRVEFNLSHSRDMALLAISPRFAVGVDVETHRAIDDPLRLARRALSEQDVAQLTAMPDADRTACFLQLWTRMEARQKAVGRGIFSHPVDPYDLTSFSFRPGHGHFAALSISSLSGTPQLRFFDYDGS